MICRLFQSNGHIHSTQISKSHWRQAQTLVEDILPAPDAIQIASATETNTR